MSSTEYGTDIFLCEKTFVFLASYAQASKFASLKHNCYIFRTQLPHLWYTSCWPCGEESDYNTVTVLIS